MTAPSTELTRTLQTLAAAHRELCEVLDAQHEAMRRFDSEAITAAARRQEAIHRRIMRLEQDRRRQVALVARPLGLPAASTLQQLAASLPEQAEALLTLRQEVRNAVAAAAARSRTCSRIAGSVLAHLNAALRLITDATVYRKSGAFEGAKPQSRLEAVA